MTNRNYLFSVNSLDTLLRSQKQKMVDEINSFEADYVLNASIESLVAYIEAKYILTTPKLCDENITAGAITKIATPEARTAVEVWKGGEGKT